jgi:putative flippase GtrA
LSATALPGLRAEKIGGRWIKFNLVGGIGIGAQLAALWVLTRALQCNYLVATALAVETAVLHNFFWHQRFTWADRAQSCWRASLVRLLQFNLTNGLVSIVGNVILMRALVSGFHMRLLLANVLSIATCSAANFAMSEMYVFRKTEAVSPRRHRGTEKIVSGLQQV